MPLMKDRTSAKTYHGAETDSPGDPQGESEDFIEDSRIAEMTDVPLKDVRNYFITLDQVELVDLALAGTGMKASITRTGRLTLGLYGAFPTPSASEPSRSRSKTG
jgi:hypothetical protein